MRVITCPHCDMKYKIDPSKFQNPELRIRCKSCNGSFSVDLSNPNSKSIPSGSTAPTATPTPPSSQAAPPAPVSNKAPSPAATLSAKPSHTYSALVAHDNEQMRDDIASMLSEAGFQVTKVKNGVDALMHIEQLKPTVAVLDVALPKMFGFEVCEIVRRDPELENVRLVLIAAIYDKTKYKRAPTNLYGADDYIEKHAIPETLVEKCLKLAEGTTSATTSAPTATATATTATTTPATSVATTAASSTIDSETLEKARRKARAIISDIALYNQEKLLEGVRNGNAAELLTAELAEGQALFDTKYDANVRNAEPFLLNALNELVANKRKELGLD